MERDDGRRGDGELGRAEGPQLRAPCHLVHATRVTVHCSAQCQQEQAWSPSSQTRPVIRDRVPPASPARTSSAHMARTGGGIERLIRDSATKKSQRRADGKTSKRDELARQLPATSRAAVTLRTSTPKRQPHICIQTELGVCRSMKLYSLWQKNVNVSWQK